MFKIVKSFALIAAVAAIAGVGTSSYFHEDTIVNETGDKDNAMTYKMATVDIDSYTGFPLNFANMAPGHEYSSHIVSVKYSGTETGDLYFGARFAGGEADLGNILKVRVKRVNPDGTNISWPIASWTNADYVYSNWTKLADNMTKNQVAYFKVYIQVDGTAGNEYQGDFAHNGVILYAVQDGFAAPTVSPQSYNPTN